VPEPRDVGEGEVRLIERVAIVTGASAGIGRAIATSIAAEGADVALAGRRIEPLEETASTIRALGPRALVVPTDVTVETDVRALVARTIEEFGRIDVLVNVAAVPGEEISVANMTLASWNETLAATLTGVMLCTRECLVRSMLTRRSGSIVNVASTAGLRGVPSRSHFSAAKAGVIQFTQALAREVGPQGIRANCIVPGAVATERLERYMQRVSASRGVAYERVVEEASRHVALRRLITPEEVAAVAIFLASEQASGVTAQTIEVTGGGDG
jgi:NAD(P)-dependent dehydrogenase (short-subunit alcohol dehydrogenase family)